MMNPTYDAPIFTEILLYHKDSSIPVRGYYSSNSRFPILKGAHDYTDVSGYTSWLPLPDKAVCEMDDEIKLYELNYKPEVSFIGGVNAWNNNSNQNIHAQSASDAEMQKRADVFCAQIQDFKKTKTRVC